MNNADPTEEMLRLIREKEKKYSTNSDSILAASCKPFTNNHHLKIDDVIEDFLYCLGGYEHNKWSSMLVKVPFTGFEGETDAPIILVQCGGHVTPAKLNLINKALIDWQATTQKKSGGSQDYCWYQPSSQNQRMRLFFASVKKRYDWRVNTNDFNFTGGLTAFLKALYKRRHQEYSQVCTN